MTSIGKGRGWARATDHETVLRRPGQSVSPKTSEIQQLVNKIKHLSLEAASLKNFAELMSFLENQSEDERTANLDKLWKNILEDRCFGVKYTEMCLGSDDKNYIKKKSLFESIRRSLYCNAQTLYNRREEFYKEKPENLTNLTWILGLILFHATGRQMRHILGQALRNCLSLLLETLSEDDIETVAIQLYLNAKFMDDNRDAPFPLKKESNDTELADIVNRARRVLIDRNVSARSRTLLLLVIEFAHQKYEPFTGQLQAFYAAALEPTYRPEDDREFNQQTYLHDLLTKGMAKSESDAVQQTPGNSIKSQQPQQHHHHQQAPQKMHQNEGNPGPVPRAIRGAGASETSKDSTNDKKSAFRNQKNNRPDKKIGASKPNTNKQNWGHDDRFHNDYE